MNNLPIEQAKDHDMASSIIAMRRAAKRSGQVAAQTGTSLIIWHDGHIERIPAHAIDTQVAVSGTKTK